MNALLMAVSEKAYKRKFEDHGDPTKNVPKEEGLFMVKKRAQRRDEGKNTIFFRRPPVERARRSSCPTTRWTALPTATPTTSAPTPDSHL